MMTAATLRYIMRDTSTQTHKRGVAQPGSAPPWGGGGGRRPGGVGGAGGRGRGGGRFRWLRGAFSFGDFRPAPSLARALRARGARPILLPAKLSLREQRQIRWDRIWTAEGCLQGEDQGWSESKVTCRGSATHKYASPQATQNRVQGRSHPQLAFHNARTARDTITR